MAIDGGSSDSPCGLAQDFDARLSLTPAERLNFDLVVVKAATGSPRMTPQQQLLRLGGRLFAPSLLRMPSEWAMISGEKDRSLVRCAES